MLWGSQLSYMNNAPTGDVLRLDAAGLTHINPGGTAVVGIRIDADGQIYTRAAGGGYTAQYFWILPSVNASLYECRWVTGGTTPDITPAASGSWVQCNVDRTWEESETGADRSYSFTLEIGLLGTSTPLASATITFSALGAP